MSEWIVVSGHVLGRCAYLDSDDLTEECDCGAILEDYYDPEVCATCESNWEDCECNA